MQGVDPSGQRWTAFALYLYLRAFTAAKQTKTKKPFFGTSQTLVLRDITGIIENQEKDAIAKLLKIGDDLWISLYADHDDQTRYSQNNM
jgi:hypothetical protein